MSPGSHVILMLLWARKETTKYMAQAHADGAEPVLHLLWRRYRQHWDVWDGGTLCVSYGL